MGKLKESERMTTDRGKVEYKHFGKSHLADRKSKHHLDLGNAKSKALDRMREVRNRINKAK